MSDRLLARAGFVLLLVGLTACAGGRARGVTADGTGPARVGSAPQTGLEVIGWMRRAHPSRALKTLTFTVTTTRYASDDREVVTPGRAYAALPGRMRVDEGPKSARTGYVRNRQRLSVFRRGQRVSTARRVDLTTLLAFDVFAQSIDTTIMWLDSADIRFALLRRDFFDGRPVWVVGAERGDETSSQFWVDAERWRVVRVIHRDPRAPRAITDTRFTEFTELLDVPVPISIEVYRNGALVEQHAISNLSANRSVPSRAFDLNRWTSLGD